MAPKKKNKKDEPAVKEYTFLTGDEMKSRELKYVNRLNELKVCVHYIDDALERVTQIDKQQLELDKWNNYVNCDPIPKPYQTPNIRLFFAKLKHFEEESIERNVDWIMSVDERSILTQNIFRKDNTFQTLKKETKKDFGIEYEKIINQGLQTLQRIDYYLDNESLMKHASMPQLKDILNRQKAIPEEIQYFFDRYTYRILCSEVAYMNPVDAISCEYIYNCPDFDLHLWCLKSVPIRFTHLSEPHVIANLNAVNIVLHVPLSVLKENLSIRALHMNFDHISPYAKSYFQKIDIPSDNINAGIQDLPECLLNEWLMQIEIQRNVSRVLRESREEYEEILRQIEAAEAAKKSAKKQDEEEKKKKVPVIQKPSREPQILPPGMFPEVYEEFLAEEQKQYENFINMVYHPNVLKLQPNEINLKKCMILGGIYQLYLVEKPKHVDFKDFNLTWHKGDGLLLVDKSWRVQQAIYSRKSLDSQRRSTSASMKSKMTVVDPFAITVDDLLPQCPWFVVTFTLPEYLCYWGTPKACHYEILRESVRVEDEQKSESRKSGELMKRAAAAAAASSAYESKVPPIGYSDITGGMGGGFSQSRLSISAYTTQTRSAMQFTENLLRVHKKNRYRSRSNFFTQSSTHVGWAAIPQYAVNVHEGEAFVRDFRLNFPLTIPQIRYMERACVPRLISSYKFPKEIRDEELAILQSRSKGKGGTIIRKQTLAMDETTDQANRNFTFNGNRDNPERLFVVFPKVEAARIADRLKSFSGELPCEPETFLQFMHILNLLKRNFQFNLRHLLDLPNFRSKTDFSVHRRRIKDKALKKRAQGSIKDIEPMEGGDNMKRASTVTASRHSKRLSKQLTKSTFSMKSNVKINAPDTQSIANYEQQDNEPPPPPPQTKPEIKEEPKEVYEIVETCHWTTEHIMRHSFDREKRKFIIVTDRLGYLGFAFNRYEHFPFKNWEMIPSEEDPENEILFTLETQYVKVVLKITEAGIRGYVTEPTKRFVRNPKMYLVIEEPLNDYTEFKKRFKEKHLNIFAEHDARFYIENGYFSEKHLATELHTYNCMATHCNHMKFISSQWNRLAQRRDIILHFIDIEDTPDNMVLVRITPDESTFVEITELCSDDLDVIKLQYTPTWRNVTPYCDLHYLICSMYLGAMDQRCKSPKLMCCIRSLLSEIRPLSFS